ncbi:hypothetical protein ACHQM5_023920 [Ranunculus cassubicifolius]
MENSSTAYYYPPPPSHPYYPPPHPQQYAPPTSLQQPPPPSYHHYTSSYPLQTAPPPPPPPSYRYYDDVRTLFIAGLPEDVAAREIYNLFREFPGYESSKLRRATEHNQPYGFAVFKDQHSAVGAMQALNGLVFDLEKQSTLYISLAKSNSKSKRSRTEDELPVTSDKRYREAATYPTTGKDTGVGSNIHMPGIGNSAYNMVDYSSTQSHAYDTGAPTPNGTETRSKSKSFIPQNTPPCPTLFVANLAPTCSEQELIQVFSRCQGFLKLKMQNKNGAPVAFVDFQDVECSTTALSTLQDTVLYTSPGEGMRLEYAKSRMGKPRKGS